MSRPLARSGRRPAPAPAGRPGRTRLLAVVAALWLAVPPVAAASPAAAHGASTSDAVHYRSHVVSVSPSVPGVTVDLARDGSWIRVRNTTDVELVVLGYDGEPYLRLGPDGAAENAASVTARVNGRFGSGLVTQDMPDREAAPAAPRWESLGIDPVATWHDARTQYAGTARPPVVAADPGHPHHLTDWTVRGRYGDRPFLVTGSLDWTGRGGFLATRTSQVLWGAAALTAVAVVLLLVAGMRRPGGTAAGRVKTRS